LLVADANPDASLVLPGTTRQFSGQVGPVDDSFVEHLQSELANFAIGPVTYTLKVQYGTSGGTVSKSISQTVIPFAVIIVGAAAAALLTAFYLLFLLASRRRKAS
jgi:hypothetical protein